MSTEAWDGYLLLMITYTLSKLQLQAQRSSNLLTRHQIRRRAHNYGEDMMPTTLIIKTASPYDVIIRLHTLQSQKRPIQLVGPTMDFKATHIRKQVTCRNLCGPEKSHDMSQQCQ